MSIRTVLASASVNTLLAGVYYFHRTKVFPKKVLLTQMLGVGLAATLNSSRSYTESYFKEWVQKHHLNHVYITCSFLLIGLSGRYARLPLRVNIISSLIFTGTQFLIHNLISKHYETCPRLEPRPIRNEQKKIFLNPQLASHLENLLKSNGNPLKGFQKVGIHMALATQNDNQRSKHLQEAYKICNQAFPKGSEGLPHEITKKYHKRLEGIRDTARKGLADSSLNIEQIYRNISKGFIDLTKQMIDDALNHLQIPQCQYSFIALGSLAREEQTPYSDLEFAVIVDRALSKKERDQFIKVSDWIHHQILLLGETPLAELGIKGVYDRKIIKKGFSLDGPVGKMAPSWNPKLVGTIDELLQYQGEEHFVERMVTPGELRNVVTICGNNHKLTEDYKSRLHEYLKQEARKNRALHLLTVDGDRFTARGGKVEERGRVVPIKYELYRAIQLRIEGISLYYGLQEQNIFDRIRKLKEVGVLSSEGATNLSKAASAILKLRCQYYLEEDCATEDKPIHDISSYFPIYQTLIPLERATESFVYGQEKEGALQKPFEYSENLTYGFLYGVFGQSEQASEYLDAALKEDQMADGLRLDVLLRLGKHVNEERDHEKGLKHLGEAETLLSSSSLALWEKAFLGAGIHSNYAALYSDRMDFSKANQSAEKALEILKTNNQSTSYIAAIVGSNIGAIFCRAKDFEKGKKALDDALEIEETFSKSHPRRALILYNRGEAYYQLKEYKKAYEDFEESEKIARRVSGESHVSVARAIKGKALYYSGGLHKDKARSLRLHQEALSRYLVCEEAPLAEIVTQYCNVGVAAAVMKNRKEVVQAFDQAEKLIPKKDHRAWKDFYSQKGNAFFDLEDFQSAVKYHKEALDIWNKEKERLGIEAPFESAFRHENYGKSLWNWGAQLYGDMMDGKTSASKGDILLVENLFKRAEKELYQTMVRPRQFRGN